MVELPTVSVIVPAYRASGTIGRALDSLLAQTHPPGEIVVVDDGSPDDQVATVARHGDRVRMLRKPNGGAASARNHGIDHSSGELLSFLDADDYWSPTKLERQLAVLAEHPEVGLIAGEYQIETPGSNSRHAAAYVPPKLADRVHRPAGAETFRTATHVWTSTVLLRRSVLGAERFDTSLRTAEDIDLWVRLLLKAPVYLISESLATMVLEAGSLSRSDVARDFPNMLTVVHRHAALLGRCGVRGEEARVYRNWAASHLGAGEGRKALAPAWRRLVRQPWSPQAWWIVAKAAAWAWTPGKNRTHSRKAPKTVFFTQKGVVSIWVGRELPDPSIDILEGLCAVDYYDVDFQEIVGNEEWSPLPVESLLRQLSYSASYLQEALAAAEGLGIREGRWALMQLDYAYKPEQIERPIAPDPVFLGCFPWHE